MRSNKGLRLSFRTVELISGIESTRNYDNALQVVVGKSAMPASLPHTASSWDSWSVPGLSSLQVAYRLVTTRPDNHWKLRMEGTRQTTDPRMA